MGSLELVAPLPDPLTSRTREELPAALVEGDR